jgi:crotonobetainyl-CoA:carnitine CoA-transferase CaiB-like acyl-CoA transferase
MSPSVKPPLQATDTALGGLRVVDFGQYIAGPLAALMMADQGAEVVRIDPPSGPRWNDPANAVLQRGKKSIALNLKQHDDLDVARRLVASADVLIENFRPGVMDRLGLGFGDCERLSPRLIYCSIPGFARDDSRAQLQGWEGIVSAASGLYTPFPAARADIPSAGAQPVISAIPIASNFAAFASANAIVAALIVRERTGRGQFIEVSLFGAAFEAFNNEAQRGSPPTHNPFHPGADNRYRCSDGRWIQLLMIAPRHLTWFVERFLPELSCEGLGAVERLRLDNEAGQRLRRALSELFLTRPAAEWDQLVNDAGVPLAICQSIDEFLAQDQQARAIEAVIELDDPELGRGRQLGYPVGMSRTPPRAQGPRRALDGDRAALLEELEPIPAAAPALVGAARLAPLQGYRIVDLSQVFAAPTGVRILAELGAEVVKVNNPYSWLIGHLQFNSGKRSILLDLEQADGIATLDRLMEGAHIVAHNLRPDAAARLGIDEDALCAKFPNIVYATVSAYGERGPKAGHRGWEPVGQAVTGMQLRAGGGDVPRLARFPLCDFGTGNLFAFAMLLGLWVQQRDGRGQHVQTSLMQAGAYHQSPYMLLYEKQMRRELGGLCTCGWTPLDRAYRASDRWFYLKADDIASLDKVVPLAVEGHVGDLEIYLEQTFATASAQIWVDRLSRAGITAHALVTVEEVMETPYALERGLSIVRQHPGVGAVRTIGPVMRFSDAPIGPLAPAPAPGWDTRAVLTEAFDATRAAQLIDEGVAAEQLSPEVMIVW